MLDATSVFGTTCLLVAFTSWYLTIPKTTNSLPEGSIRPSLLVNSTFHSRFLPILHSFRYPVLYIGIDLDTIGYVDRLFSSQSKAWRVLTLRSEDYLGQKYSGTIKEKLWSHLKDHDVETANLKRALLITTPRLFGYSFNPVSFHYIYDVDNRLSVVVLEVNNTFGEKHVYVLQQDKADEVPRKGYTSAQTFPRRFHVSPFNDRSGSYRLQCLDPLAGNFLRVSMHLTLLDVDGTKKLTAQVDSTSSPVDTSLTSSAAWTLVKYGSAVFLTMPRILLQAYKIHYGKKLAVYLRPEPYEDIGAIGRSQASATDSYFAELVFEYLRTNVEWLPCHKIVFHILPAPSASQHVVIDGSGFEDTLEITVLSWTFFSSLVTSESPLTCLWTDSLALPSPLCRTTNQTLFLRVFSAGFGRRLSGKWYLQDVRARYRGRPDWFTQLREVEPDHAEFLGLSNCAFDNHVFDMAAKGKRTLWAYRYHVLTSLWLAWFGNSLFGAIATFAGDAGRPADEWLRVKLEFERRRDGTVITDGAQS